MSGFVNGLVDSSMQCWGCPVFDRLFQVISAAAAAVYRQFSLFCILIFCLILVFYILYAVWKNIHDGVPDPLYQKSIKPILINSLFVFALLGLGVYLPRFVTTVTFEPVADMTLFYTQSMIKTDTETVEAKVTYQPKQMPDDGFYRPQLRDKIILLMKTTITVFQNYVHLGIAIMDKAFSWTALFGIGALVKHILMFMMGLFLAYNFFKLFMRFCFYFVDVIVAMTFFAFFFPLAVVLWAFKNSDAPDWVKKLGGEIGADQFKKVINAIIALTAAVITYTVIMVIIARFFSGDGVSMNELMDLILSGEIYAGALSDDNLAAMTVMGAIVMVYIVNFLADQVPKVAAEMLSAFDIKESDIKKATELSEGMADDATKVLKNVVDKVKEVGKVVTGKADDKKEEKKDDKKEEKK